jgi:hypothetical protein
MDKEQCSLQMAPDIPETGLTITNKVKERPIGPMEDITRESMSMAKSTVKVRQDGQTMTTTVAIMYRINGLGTES